jgi:hypothetical protein
MDQWIGKVVKLPECDNSIVIPVRYSGGGYVCTDIRSNGDIISAECYISEQGFINAIDLTAIIKEL